MITEKGSVSRETPPDKAGNKKCPEPFPLLLSHRYHALVKPHLKSASKGAHTYSLPGTEKGEYKWKICQGRGKKGKEAT